MVVDVGDTKGRVERREAAGIGRHENRAVLDISDGGEETKHFVGAEDDREGAWLFDGWDALQHLVAAERDAVEES